MVPVGLRGGESMPLRGNCHGTAPNGLYRVSKRRCYISTRLEQVRLCSRLPQRFSETLLHLGKARTSSALLSTSATLLKVSLLRGD